MLFRAAKMHCAFIINKCAALKVERYDTGVMKITISGHQLFNVLLRFGTLPVLHFITFINPDLLSRL